MISTLITQLRQKQRGFYYVEVLISVLLLVILLVPALRALSTGVMNNPGTLAARQLNLRNKMEEVLSQPFNVLNSSIPISITSPTINGTYSDPSTATDRRVVVLYRYDTATGTITNNDTGLIYVSVYYANDGSNSALNTLVGRWW